MDPGGGYPSTDTGRDIERVEEKGRRRKWEKYFTTVSRLLGTFSRVHPAPFLRGSSVVSRRNSEINNVKGKREAKGRDV